MPADIRALRVSLNENLSSKCEQPLLRWQPGVRAAKRDDMLAKRCLCGNAQMPPALCALHLRSHSCHQSPNAVWWEGRRATQRDREDHQNHTILTNNFTVTHQKNLSASPSSSIFLSSHPCGPDHSYLQKPQSLCASVHFHFSLPRVTDRGYKDSVIPGRRPLGANI